jgi:cysteine desulfurase family protein
MKELGAPAGRSAYAEAVEVERLVAGTRRQLAMLLGVADPNRIIFTSNATDSLNLALHGTLSRGDHVVTTTVEHNSVLRPLRHLQLQRGVGVTYVECNERGRVDPAAIEAAITPKTRLIAMTHASNVTGTIQPVEQVGELAAERRLLFLVDAAQTLGHLPVQVDDTHCSLMAGPCHKGLLGPLGLGFLYVAPGTEHLLESVRQGGTGTVSESDRQPESLPDKYESGNLNVPAIVGLGAGLDYLDSTGVGKLRQEYHSLTSRLLEGLLGTAGITVHGPPDAEHRVGVVSISVSGYDPQEVASVLDSAFRIQVRGGLHCAPLVHRAIGTFDRGGTVRFSTGPFNTIGQIERAIDAVREIATAGVAS